MPKKKSKAELKRRAVVDDALYAAFPLAFPTDPAQIRPLAINTREAVVAWSKSARVNGVSEKSVTKALHRYCARLSYKNKVTAGTWRINLHGEPTEQVTVEAEAHAKAYIEQTLARQAQAEIEKAERRAKAEAEKSAAQAKPKPAQKPKAEAPAKQKAKPVAAITAPAPKPAPAAPAIIVKKKRRIVA